MSDETTILNSGSVEEATMSLLNEPTNQENQEAVEASDATINSEEVEQENISEASENDEAVKNIPEQTFEVKVDGEVEEWTLDMLKQSASGQKYIQKEMQKTAQLKKQAEQTFADLQKEREQLSVALGNYEKQLNQSEIQKPDISLVDTDPIEWSIQNAKWQEAQLEKNALSQKRQKMAFEQQQQNEQAMKAYLAQEAETLKKEIPEFSNQDTAIPMRGKLVTAGQTYGFTEDEVANIVDSRAIRVLNDARKWQELQSNGTVDKKVSKARPFNIKPEGRQSVTSSNSKAIKEAQAKFQQSGSVDDGANWLLATSN